MFFAAAVWRYRKRILWKVSRTQCDCRKVQLEIPSRICFSWPVFTFSHGSERWMEWVLNVSYWRCAFRLTALSYWKSWWMAIGIKLCGGTTTLMLRNIWKLGKLDLRSRHYALMVFLCCKSPPVTLLPSTFSRSIEFPHLIQPMISSTDGLFWYRQYFFHWNAISSDFHQW